MKLTENERQALRMLAGEINLPWAPWIAPCLKALVSYGYSTEIPYSITEAGRAALRESGDA